jgi:hypothetical protein
MRFSPDACITCGTKFRRPYTSQLCPSDSDFITDNQGTFLESYFWFCSDECIIKAVESFLDRRFHYDRTPYNDPNLPDHHIEEWAEAWFAQRDIAIEAAQKKLIDRAVGEHLALVDKQNAAYAKEEEKARLAREKELKQLESDKQKKLDQARKEAQQKEDQIFEQAALDNEIRQREDVFNPKPIPPNLRYEHIHVLAPTGAGKTTLLQHLILKDFRDYGKEAAHVIIDPKGAMIERLAKLQVFDHAWADRLIIIDPFDQPAFNIFALKAQNAAQLISNFSYIFSTVGQKLTTPQETCFSYCAALLLKMPGANLTTLLELLEDGTGKPANRGEPPPRDPRFTALINSLTEPKDRQLRRYFERDFYDTARDLIKSRINTILSEENLAAMFDSRTCQIDIADCIEKKKIVLVNTRLVEMGNKHQVVGRFIISLFQQAILGRRSTHPAFIFIDEFQEFADEEKTPQLLRLIREYKGGAVLAHQNMVCAELTANSQAAISLPIPAQTISDVPAKTFAPSPTSLPVSVIRHPNRASIVYSCSVPAF